MQTLVTDDFDEEPEDVFDAHFRKYLEFYGQTQEQIARVLRRAGSFGGRNG